MLSVLMMVNTEHQECLPCDSIHGRAVKTVRVKWTSAGWESGAVLSHSHGPFHLMNSTRQMELSPIRREETNVPEVKEFTRDHSAPKAVRTPVIPCLPVTLGTCLPNLFLPEPCGHQAQGHRDSNIWLPANARGRVPHTCIAIYGHNGPVLWFCLWITGFRWLHKSNFVEYLLQMLPITMVTRSLSA